MDIREIYAQWVGVDESTRGRIEKFKSKSPEEQASFMEEKHGKHSPDFVQLFRMAQSIDSHYLMSVVLPQYPIKIIRRAFQAWTGNDADFSDFMKQAMESYQETGSLPQSVKDLLSDISVFVYLFDRQAPQVIQKLRKKLDDTEISLHALSSMIQSAMSSYSDDLQEAEKFSEYLAKISDWGVANISKGIQVFPLVREQTPDPAKLNAEQIKEIIREHKQRLADASNDAVDPLYASCMKEGADRGLSMSQINQAYKYMQSALENRAGRDNMPDGNFDFPINDPAIQKAMPGAFVRFRRIPSDDPRQLYLGHGNEYPCCYQIGGLSDSALFYSIASPNAANYEVLLMHPEDPEPQLKMATSYTWRDEEGNICFDNIEVGADYFKFSDMSGMHNLDEILKRAYTSSAQQMLEQTGGRVSSMGLDYVEDAEENLVPGENSLMLKRYIPGEVIDLIENYNPGFMKTGVLSSFDMVKNGDNWETERFAPPNPIIIPLPQEISQRYSDAETYQRLIAGKAEAAKSIHPRLAENIAYNLIQCLNKEDLSPGDKSKIVEYLGFYWRLALQRDHSLSDLDWEDEDGDRLIKEEVKEWAGNRWNDPEDMHDLYSEAEQEIIDENMSEGWKFVSNWRNFEDSMYYSDIFRDFMDELVDRLHRERIEESEDAEDEGDVEEPDWEDVFAEYDIGSEWDSYVGDNPDIFNPIEHEYVEEYVRDYMQEEIDERARAAAGHENAKLLEPPGRSLHVRPINTTKLDDATIGTLMNNLNLMPGRMQSDVIIRLLKQENQYPLMSVPHHAATLYDHAIKMLDIIDPTQTYRLFQICRENRIQIPKDILLSHFVKVGTVVKQLVEDPGDYDIPQEDLIKMYFQAIIDQAKSARYFSRTAQEYIVNELMRLNIFIDQTTLQRVFGEELGDQIYNVIYQPNKANISLDSTYLWKDFKNFIANEASELALLPVISEQLKGRLTPIPPFNLQEVSPGDAQADTIIRQVAENISNISRVLSAAGSRSNDSSQPELLYEVMAYYLLREAQSVTGDAFFGILQQAKGMLDENSNSYLPLMIIDRRQSIVNILLAREKAEQASPQAIQIANWIKSNPPTSWEQISDPGAIPGLEVPSQEVTSMIEWSTLADKYGCYRYADSLINSRLKAIIN